MREIRAFIRNPRKQNTWPSLLLNCVNLANNKNPHIYLISLYNINNKFASRANKGALTREIAKRQSPLQLFAKMLLAKAVPIIVFIVFCQLSFHGCWRDSKVPLSMCIYIFKVLSKRAKDVIQKCRS